ncbi:MAG TPA: hypothetical protein VIE12_03455 [Actinomycetota bacterium]|jgi:hypothetical protein
MQRLSQRTVMAVDMLLLAWVLLWVWVGVETAQRVGSLRSLGDGVVSAGQATTDVADAIGGLADLPVIGSAFDAVASAIGGVGDATTDLGTSGQRAVDRAAALMGWALALAPTVPFLAIWVPFRVIRERERSSIRSALAADDAAALAYLAHAAVTSRPYRELRAVTSDPMADLEGHRYRALAALQLRRLELDRFVRDDAGHVEGAA